MTLKLEVIIMQKEKEILEKLGVSTGNMNNLDEPENSALATIVHIHKLEQDYPKYLTNDNIKVTGFDNSKIGKNTITVEYDGHKTTFEVEIILKQLSKIEIISNPSKIKYIQKKLLTFLNSCYTLQLYFITNNIECKYIYCKYILDKIYCVCYCKYMHLHLMPRCT